MAKPPCREQEKAYDNQPSSQPTFMNWYYVEQGQQAGPVDDAQLEELRRSGRIQADTLVWRDGMANWAPYSEAKGEPAGLRLATPAVAAAPAASGVPEAV